MSQQDLAKRSGVALETLRQIGASRDSSRPQLNPRLATIDKLAAALGVEPAELLETPES